MMPDLLSPGNVKQDLVEKGEAASNHPYPWMVLLVATDPFPTENGMRVIVVDERGMIFEASAERISWRRWDFK